jgi:hypothetical protein
VATRTWTGSGNWSSPSNWDTGVPESSDTALFNSTSTSNCTIDTDISIVKIYIRTGYTGTITQSANVTLTDWQNTEATSATFNSNPSYTFTVSNDFNCGAGIFKRYTGTGTAIDPCVVSDVYGLQGARTQPSLNYKVGINIYASSTLNWAAGAGFYPIGTSSSRFTATFDGNNKIIFDLYINRPATTYISLIGHAQGATITNTKLRDVNFTGDQYTSGLVARAQSAAVSGCSVTGSLVGGIYYVGGLVAFLNGSVEDSYTDCDVSGGSPIGGLVGWLYSGSVSRSYSLGTTTGNGSVGGLIGHSDNTVMDCFSSGTVNVNGTNSVGGGLFGFQNAGVYTYYCYSTCNVISGSGVLYNGGLIGELRGEITGCYSAGTVSGSGTLGGLIGSSGGSITNSYFTDSTHNNGRGTLESDVTNLYGSSHTVYTDWDFVNDWDETETFPILEYMIVLADIILSGTEWDIPLGTLEAAADILPPVPSISELPLGTLNEMEDSLTTRELELEISPAMGETFYGTVV